MFENIHSEADNTTVAQNDHLPPRLILIQVCRGHHEPTTILFDIHQENGYEFEAINGNDLPMNQSGPIQTRRVICDTGKRQSSIPVRILRELFWSYAGPNLRARSEVTTYLANASLTPISIGFDARTVPESNRLEIRNAEVSLVADTNFITLGWEDLNRLGFFILPAADGSPRRFGFEIDLEEDEVNAEELEDESETESDDSSEEDV